MNKELIKKFELNKLLFSMKLNEMEYLSIHFNQNVKICNKRSKQRIGYSLYVILGIRLDFCHVVCFIVDFKTIPLNSIGFI